MCIVSSISSICFCYGSWLADWLKGTALSCSLMQLPENPSLMVQTALSMHWWLVVGRVPPFPTFCSALFWELCSLLLVLIVSYSLPLVSGVVMGIDGCLKRAVSPFHVRSMWLMRFPEV